MTETVNVMEFTKKEFKSLIKKLIRCDHEYLNDPRCSDDERKSIIEIIPTYIKVLKGTETVREAVELIYDLHQLESSMENLDVKTVMSSAIYYLLERHDLVLEEMKLT